MEYRRSNSRIVFQVLFLVFLAIMGTKAFNMDTRWPLVFSGDADSLFGFSVALHKEGAQHMLLVGAPTKDNAGEVEKEGAFYKCNIGEYTFTGPCDQVQLDVETGHPRDSEGRQYGNKSNSFLGATVRSAGDDGPVLVCAPSYVWYINPAQSENDDGTFREPVGRCYIIQDNFSDIGKYEPCVNEDDRSTHFENKLTHCQAGLGGDISMDNVLVGGPGSFYWQGQIFLQDVDRMDPPWYTWEASLFYDDSYRGYTVLFGDLNDDGRLDSVVSSPRAPNMFGAVAVYDHRLRPLYNKTGTQLGEFFGNSLAVTDLDNDGKNDLIVGAPMYTDQEQKTQNFEIGRIYVFKQTGKDGRAALADAKTIITGRSGGGRFGFSLTSLGDIDADGFNDLAVGAPFEGDGVVYIFKGSDRGITSTNVQIVRPGELGVTGSPLKGFGFSLHGNRDIDGNSYPDLAVGSHISSQAVILRSRPVIKMTASIEFNVENIDLENPNLNLTDSMQVPSFNITTCVRYTGTGVMRQLPFRFTLQLDSVKTVSPRALFHSNDKREIRWERALSKKIEYCTTFIAYVENAIRDKINPVQFQFTYELDTDEITRDDGDLLPILKDQSYVTSQLVLLTNCSNERCLPDLKVDIDHNLEEVVVGKPDRLIFDVNYVNNGDEAFEARLHALIPEEVAFVQVESLSSDLLVECVEFIHPSRNLVCHVGNPVRARHRIPFRLHFEVSVTDKENEHLRLYFVANSSNIDDPETLHDNSKNISIPLKIRSQLDFSGYSNPEQLIYSTNFTLSSNATTEAEVGMDVVHYYILKNAGPSDVGNSTLRVQWPMYTKAGDYLLYLTRVSPSTGECDEIDDINPKELQLEKQSNDSFARVIEEASRRDRRDTQGPTAQPQVMVNCETGQCVEIRCRFGPLAVNAQPIVLGIRSRLWLHTLLKDVNADGVLPSDWVISSSATLKIISHVYSLPGELPDPRTATTTTYALPESTLRIVKSEIPWWVFLLGGLIGFLILSCLILTAWKFGFFKRKKIGEDEDLFK